MKFEKEYEVVRIEKLSKDRYSMKLRPIEHSDISMVKPDLSGALDTDEGKMVMRMAKAFQVTGLISAVPIPPSEQKFDPRYGDTEIEIISTGHIDFSIGDIVTLALIKKD